MSTLTRITVTAPAQAIADLDAVCDRVSASRSALVARAIAEFLDRNRDADLDAAYTAAYLRQPESSAANAAVAAAATAAWDAWP